MAGIAQLVRALDCDSRCRRFKSGCPPQLKIYTYFKVLFSFLIIFGCSGKQEYPEDPVVKILRRQGQFGEVKVQQTQTSQTKKVRENFHCLYKFIAKEYGIEKYKADQIIISKNKNNQKIQIILIEDDIQIQAFSVNQKNQIQESIPIPQNMRLFINKLKAKN